MWEKRIITCDVGTAQCEDWTVKCEKKIREPSNVTKEQSHINVETSQYEDEIVKCDVLETWYNRLLTNGYRKKKKKRECAVELLTFKIIINI